MSTVTSSNSISPRECLANAADSIQAYLRKNNDDRLFFNQRYVSWANQKRQCAELQIALDIINRNLSSYAVPACDQS